jgi:hypothetical protein
VKVLDYGLVKEIAGDGGTSGHIVLGTPAYLAPENVTAPDEVGPAADLYALGAVGYFLLTGTRVFDGKTALDVCVQHVSARPRPPSSVTTTPMTSDIEALLLRCLAKAPHDRPASAAELAELLHATPQANAWSTGDAHAWWNAHRRSFQTDAETSSTATLTIDLDVGGAPTRRPCLLPRCAGEFGHAPDPTRRRARALRLQPTAAGSAPGVAEPTAVQLRQLPPRRVRQRARSEPVLDRLRLRRHAIVQRKRVHRPSTSDRHRALQRSGLPVERSVERRRRRSMRERLPMRSQPALRERPLRGFDIEDRRDRDHALSYIFTISASEIRGSVRTMSGAQPGTIIDGVPLLPPGGVEPPGPAQYGTLA